MLRFPPCKREGRSHKIHSFAITPEDRILQFASLNFDASIFELAMGLCAGATICLATVAQKWRLKLAPGQTIALQPQLTLRARRGIKMRIEPRI